MRRKLLGIINVGSDATGRLLIIYSAFVKCLRKNGEKNEAVHQLFTDFKKAYDSIRREVLYNYKSYSVLKSHFIGKRSFIYNYDTHQVHTPMTEIKATVTTVLPTAENQNKEQAK